MRFLKSRESVVEFCVCRLKMCSCDDGLYVFLFCQRFFDKVNAFSEKPRDRRRILRRKFRFFELVDASFWFFIELSIISNIYTLKTVYF